MTKVVIRAKATAAALTVGIGFKPDRVRVLNVTDKTELIYDGHALAGSLYGITVAAAGDKAAAAAAVNGIILADGEGVLGSASTAKLVAKDDDLKGTITQFTLDNSTNKTGHFDVALATATCGVGSRVVLNGKVYTIVALSNDGDAANDVTLDAAPVDTVSAVDSVFSIYTHRGAAATDAIPAGITIGASATVNDTDGDLLLIEAERL